MATIGFVLPGWPGHDNPAVRLARILEAAGHRVCTWRSRDLGEHVPVLPPRAAGAAPPSPGTVQYYVAAWRLQATTKLTGPLIERLGEAAVDLVVYDSMTPWGGLAADWLGLPRVVSLAHYPWPVVVTEPAPPPVADRLASDRTRLLERWGIDIGDPLALLAPRGDLTYFYSTPRVSGLPAEESLRFVGPLLPASPITKRAGGPRPLVYVSLGTSFNRDVAVHRAVLEALGELDVDVLVSTGGGFAEGELAPLPQNVEIAAWPDQGAALAAASVFVTQGGATSVHEALVAGVPMLVLPQAADQHHWGKRIEALGAGAALAEPDVDAIRSAARRLVEDPGPRGRTAEVGRELVAHDGATVATAGVDALLAAS